ncbi:hypothetical protein Calag_1295 [Caldisphaera lagunensis DSM 15908]|uniref:Ribbon-helix-helix protein, copG family n=1 Tax=Caldisphaera lagunensis (strain DSM 15908 / JCM 11604 / ANMR 0165 / IC-154) TaxID=1056495 RepID=L0AC47_CALLD|nr:hypothetical protein [Caldisphaera lagunensis]AFZ71009.1 hypothetical protein Calag_1295 [Caldisphaera lagunensis DSM 15908]
MEYENNVIVLNVKPTNDITISSKISSYELNLINMITEKCGISRSSFIRFSIHLALSTLFSEKEINDEWKPIIDQYKIEFENIIKKCKNNGNY